MKATIRGSYRIIHAEAFPGGRKGHIEGERCPCNPYRDLEVPTVLVHRKLGSA